MKMPKRTTLIKLEGDYEGFECTIITSFPMSVFSYFKTGQWDLIQSALQMILVDWNFVDHDGKPLPQPGEKVPALDPFGQIITIDKVDSKGEVEQDEAGNNIQIPVEVPAVSLIPPELGMIIVGKASEASMNVSTP